MDKTGELSDAISYKSTLQNFEIVIPVVAVDFTNFFLGYTFVDCTRIGDRYLVKIHIQARLVGDIRKN